MVYVPMSLDVFMCMDPAWTVHDVDNHVHLLLN